ncbi:2-amino-4-hydroxy-6-hydroxymethyldihydropteridine diphosphokinase [Paucilactobacillus nenjiangensis]|uniref:2-amino-4-hydroxy-6-hydroxymethyldihydropteridine diphosphokinase n=1 Tax=Paucilactobacillus nenjiangensis TaxID=1296540 RepID=A0A5P1X2X1_9LACO|nr:2-amino-4-hydroxy-6-hydroxymethyldihydropteridine diphosphokinase [Paucilactobacillus nenjiangensis]QER67234.1 2-amino-4-hydroxy-6-hydroxymethyldihydropteridine diphosphokinase [Paucilactobacillus nenjiangensis]
MAKAYLSIGSNIGNRIENLQAAIDGLRKAGISVEQISHVYETEPVGGVVQDDFLNLAVRIATQLTAHELLDQLHIIEQNLHRKRLIHWGPRTIDLDILYYANEIINDETLTVPHPEIKNRQFVLVPLLEVANQDLKNQVQQMLEVTSDHNLIVKTNKYGGIE